MWIGIEQMLFKMKQYTQEEYYAHFPMLEHWLLEQEKLLTPKKKHRITIVNLCENLTLELHEYPIWMRVHLLSFCMKCCEEKKYAEWLIQEALEANGDELKEYHKYFLYWQITSAVFQNVKLQSKSVERGRAKLYRALYQAFYDAYQVRKYGRIPVEQRNPELVFVFTSQFLTLEHGPTKSVCDRAYCLKKYLGKEVAIINTALLTPSKGEMPCYRIRRGNYISEYPEKASFKFQDEEFEYNQCGNDMPDLSTIQAVLKRVAEEKPYCIVSIGDGDLCADLCGNLVPQIAICTVSSELAITASKIQVIERDLQADDYEILQILGVEPENVKKALFTYTFKEQKNHYSRKELGLKEDSVVLQINGWRLTTELQDDFLQMLENVLIMEDCTEVIFMGRFEDYKERICMYPHLKERSHYFENHRDSLAVTECCDIYVNPKRKGGGTSAAEALYMGLPVVTLPYGDVAAAAGQIFHVKDYYEMSEKIRAYCHDKAFYDKMSELAGKRAAALTDSRTHFCELFREIESQPDFR